MSTLVGFEHPGQYGNALIKPARKVNEPLICQEWPNVQRIMASLAQKDVTQATIVRKLSAYARQNKTKKALWELDNICRTLYILDFIDDVTLRQSVQKALTAVKRIIDSAVPLLTSMRESCTSTPKPSNRSGTSAHGSSPMQ